MIRVRSPAPWLALGVAAVCVTGLLSITAWSDRPPRGAPRRAEASGPREAGLVGEVQAAEGVVAASDVERATERAEDLRRIATSGTVDEALAAVEQLRAKERLAWFSRRAREARVRIRAMRALAGEFGAAARPTLLEAVGDVDESALVRREAARLVGRTRDGAGAELERLIASDLPRRVRGGAVLGLAELGTDAGASRILELAVAPEHPLNPEAETALGRAYAPDAARRLAALMIEEAMSWTPRLSEAAREAACRSLGRSGVPEARGPLTSLLAQDKSEAVRAAAARALGVLGGTDSLRALESARADREPRVVSAAEEALSRLSRFR